MQPLGWCSGLLPAQPSKLQGLQTVHKRARPFVLRMLGNERASTTAGCQVDSPLGALRDFVRLAGRIMLGLV